MSYTLAQPGVQVSGQHPPGSKSCLFYTTSSDFPSQTILSLFRLQKQSSDPKGFSWGLGEMTVTGASVMVLGKWLDAT